MGKRLMLFKSGKYNPQGEFSAQDVKNIFGQDVKVPAIFIHSSKWKDKGKAPITVGEFSSIEVEEKDGIATAYGTLEFNDKGKGYAEDGIFGGVSVEIPGRELKNIAILPVGVNPAVKGTEFQEGSIYLEFEEPVQIEFEKNIVQIADIIEAITSLDVTTVSKDILNILSDTVYKKLDIKYYIEKLKTDGYTVEKTGGEFQDYEGLSIQEIVTRTMAVSKAEFEAETVAKESTIKFFEDNKLKITPAMKTAGLTQEFMEHIQKNNYEFQEGSGVGEVIISIFKAIPNIIQTGSSLGDEEEFQLSNDPYQAGINSAKDTFGLQ